MKEENKSATCVKRDQRRILTSESVSELEDQLNFKSRVHCERLQPAPESPRPGCRAGPGMSAVVLQAMGWEWGMAAW